LEEIVNLKDPIFQEGDFVLYEVSTNTTCDISKTNTEGDANIDFDPKSLVDTILAELDN
ncbi:31826_t:CDS:1, partial [Racocetra persica]